MAELQQDVEVGLQLAAARAGGPLPGSTHAALAPRRRRTNETTVERRAAVRVRCAPARAGGRVRSRSLAVERDAGSRRSANRTGGRCRSRTCDPQLVELML